MFELFTASISRNGTKDEASEVLSGASADGRDELKLYRRFSSKVTDPSTTNKIAKQKIAKSIHFVSTANKFRASSRRLKISTLYRGRIAEHLPVLAKKQ